MASKANREVEAAIQAGEEEVGGVAGAGDVLEGPEDQGGPSGHDSQMEPGNPQGQDCPGSPSSHCAPGSPDGQGGASAPGNEGGPVVPEDHSGLGAHYDQSGSGAQDNPGSPDGQYEQADHRGLGSPGVEEWVRSAAVGSPNIQRAVCGSGPVGDAGPEHERPGHRPIIFTIAVPFESHFEAEMARLAMDIESPHHRQAVQKEFRKVDC